MATEAAAILLNIAGNRDDGLNRPGRGEACRERPRSGLGGPRHNDAMSCLSAAAPDASFPHALGGREPR